MQIKSHFLVGIKTIVKSLPFAQVRGKIPGSSKNYQKVKIFLLAIFKGPCFMRTPREPSNFAVGLCRS